LKLGKGELKQISEVGSTLSMHEARDYFLIAVKEVAPAVLDDLADAPFKLYKAAGLAFDRETHEKDVRQFEVDGHIPQEYVKAHLIHTWNRPYWLEHFETREIDFAL
jgi:hypothetical protein